MGEESKIEILVVDDNEGHIELIRRNLRRGGISNEIVALTDGQSALDYIYRNGKYTDRVLKNELLILLDINMPGGMNGIEVLRVIKSDPDKKKIPVMMLTTTDDSKEIERCYSLGCNAYIIKPVDSANFMETIHRLGLLLSIVRVPAESKQRGVDSG